MTEYKRTFAINEVESFWNSVADIYNKSNDKIGYGHRQRYIEATRYLEPGNEKTEILNIWSRMGGCISYIREVIPESTIVNMEVADKFLEFSKKAFPKEVFLKTDFINIEFDLERFDYIISLETIEHVPDPLLFLQKLHPVLKKEGKLILSCPPRWAEFPLKVYEFLFQHHGEGPHYFPKIIDVKKMLNLAGFRLLEHKGTVFFPLGSDWLQKSADTCQSLFRFALNDLGIRHFYIAEKK